ncbi:hypothetical protein QJS10_CPA10g00780 [Acorus calamus]|uniref:Uncharacterized protein n=1 Tax=Acorus calamus TaxID=4465 RepID=A0AAV9DZ93_ACOCL|nr:hypothetical protein QJS10_CPA10g00780 [Acorus calamus]
MQLKFQTKIEALKKQKTKIKYNPTKENNKSTQKEALARRRNLYMFVAIDSFFGCERRSEGLVRNRGGRVRLLGCHGVWRREEVPLIGCSVTVEGPVHDRGGAVPRPSRRSAD